MNFIDQALVVYARYIPLAHFGAIRQDAYAIYLDAKKSIGGQRGGSCGRGWVGLKGACKRAKGDKAKAEKDSRQELANKLRKERGLKSREEVNLARSAAISKIKSKPKPEPKARSRRFKRKIDPSKFIQRDAIDAAMDAYFSWVEEVKEDAVRLYTGAGQYKYLGKCGRGWTGTKGKCKRSEPSKEQPKGGKVSLRGKFSNQEVGEILDYAIAYTPKDLKKEISKVKPAAKLLGTKGIIHDDDELDFPMDKQARNEKIDFYTKLAEVGNFNPNEAEEKVKEAIKGMPTKKAQDFENEYLAYDQEELENRLNHYKAWDKVADDPEFKRPKKLLANLSEQFGEMPSAEEVNRELQKMETGLALQPRIAEMNDDALDRLYRKFGFE